MTRVQLDIHDPPNRLTLRAILMADGCEIVTDDPEVVITDDFLKAGEYAQRGPCLVLARAAEIREAAALMRRGVYGYIFVPFQPGEAGIMVQRAAQWRTAASPRSAPETPAVTGIAEAEARLIQGALRQCKNNHTRAARLLGIGRNTLWRKLKRIQKHSEAVTRPPLSSALEKRNGRNP